MQPLTVENKPKEENGVAEVSGQRALPKPLLLGRREPFAQWRSPCEFTSVQLVSRQRNW